MTNAYWDGLAPEYDRFYSSPYHRAEDIIVAAVVQHAVSSLRPSAKILDLACGAGWVPDRIIMGNPRGYLGLDASAGMLERARGKHPRLIFAEGNAESMAEVAGKKPHFDLVVCLFSFYLFPQPDSVLKQMAGVLRPGGRLVMTFHGQGSRLFHPSINRHGQFYTTRKVGGWLAEAGFRDVEFCGLSGPLRHVLGRVPGDAPVGALMREAASWGRKVPNLCDHVVVRARKAAVCQRG